MTKLPKLAEHVERKLDLQWRELTRSHGLTEECLKLPNARRANGELRTADLQLSYEHAVAESLVTRTTLLAKERFEQVAGEYFAIWVLAANARTEVFTEWIGEIKAAVESELTRLWAASEWHPSFQLRCVKTASKDLASLTGGWESRANRLEIQHLESPHLSLRSLLAASGDLNVAVTLEQGEQTIRLLKSLEAMDSTAIGKPPIPTEADEHRSTQEGTHNTRTEDGGALPNPGTLVNRSDANNMNLTPQQRDLLFEIVDAHASGHGSRFIFTHGLVSSGITYPDHYSVRVDADDDDLSLLERKRLVDILGREPGRLIVIRAELTELGIKTAALLRREPVPTTANPSDAAASMRNEWNIAWSRFVALRTHPPSAWYEDDVRQFNDIVTALEAFGHDLALFRVSNDMLKFRPTAIQRAGRSGRFPGSVQMSTKRSCDEQYVRRQMEAIALYFHNVSMRAPVPRAESDPVSQRSVTPDAQDVVSQTTDSQSGPTSDNPREAIEGPGSSTIAVGKDDGADGRTSSWEDIEIRFTSEHHAQIFVRGRPGDSINFADMGFEDRRGGGGKPIRAWALLVALAHSEGIYPAAKVSGDQTIQKRAQELRDRLAGYFHIAGDPLPFLEGTGYKSRFKISRSPSFET